MPAHDEALLELGQLLARQNYRFITPAPETHRRVVSRGGEARSLPDIFGWSKPFRSSSVAAEIIELLQKGEALESLGGGLLRSAVRFSSLDGLLLMHSRYPTDQTEAVFFGPDTYRFGREVCALLKRHPQFSPRTVVDIGAGTGAGGLLCGSRLPNARIVLADINTEALRMASINASLNGLSAQTVRSDVLDAVEDKPDLIISNPPYLVDAAARTYRHGGGAWGCELSVRILRESLARMPVDGKLLLYTGAPVVDGIDVFLEAAKPLLEPLKSSVRYEEVDPDVFGEELERAPYDRADRIAAVVVIIE